MIKKIFSIFICLLCFGCFSSKDTKPQILVTIPPYASLVRSLVGDQVDVQIFVPPGVNPHTYEPSPAQIKHFAQAKVWFRIGDPIENKMVHFLEQHHVQIVDLSKNTHDEQDLHLWLNPSIVIEQVEEMMPILIEQFPEIASILKNNCAKLKTELKQLDSEISSKLTSFQGRYLLVSHPALGYYCQRYGLHQLSVEVEGKDPLPQDIAHLMSELKIHPVPVVLIEPQYNKKGAVLIADKLHIPSEEINPYAEDYFGMLNYLTEIIIKHYKPIYTERGPSNL
ncbi:MAG: metal ABC transporter substrate-binding protein [Rhabdochlamydiaceae bacterium]